jgi:cell division protein FtsW
LATKKPLHFNYPLLFTILALLACGLVMLYSVSTVESFEKFGNTTHFFKEQLTQGVLLGLVALFIASRIDYHVWQKYLPVILLAALALLMLVKVPGVGWEYGGATRWVKLGPITFQPSELAKIALIVYLATWVDKKRKEINDFYFGLLPSLCIIGLFALLILWQPDLGTMLVLLGTATVMLFVAGVNWKHFFWTGSVAVLTLLLLVKLEPYRMRRITTFFDPSIDPRGISYQINQALMAIGAGGLWGYGYGLSRQKHNYLPEAIGDSMFAVVSEELGFVRVLVVIALYVIFTLIGIRIAKNAPDVFGRMLAIGITAWVAVQAFINIGAMVHIIPLTGVPLPFFSYGSSSMLVMLGSLGILLNISRYSHVAKK